MSGQQFVRHGSVMVYEQHIEAAPGEWLRRDGQPTVSDAINKYLAEQGASLAPLPQAAPHPKLVEQRDGGKTRVYLVTAAFTYIPSEVIQDATIERPGAGQAGQADRQEAEEEEAPSPLSPTVIPLGSSGAIDISQLARTFNLPPAQLAAALSAGQQPPRPR